MIHAGRAHLVLTLADLAAAAGKTPKTFSNQKLHERPGHPAPINSPRARVRLWDGEQVDAYAAGLPIPPLPAQENPDDLLDRNEAAELAGVAPRTWDRYANLPGMRPRPQSVTVAGVEHWRRGEILEWLAARPGLGSSPGRPAGTTETAPRASIPKRAAELLAHEPSITAARATAALGVTPGTAQRALARARTAAVSELLREDPGLTADDVHDRLGYPRWAAARALHTARTQPSQQTRKAAGPEAP
ncbi:helix-turn-helix transcriptional regulator [Streptomyces griseosporeus]|uniref:helix-turn-helix transcriptional regulator n=1 Tax=Streptomyces griseosporeus TaxID=1910 RepID=UPI0036CD4DD4